MLAICVARSISLGTKLPDESRRSEWRMGLLSGPWVKRVILRASWLKFFPPQLNWPKERGLVKYDMICNTSVSPFSFPRYSSRGILSVRPLPSSLLQIADKKVQLGSLLRRISHALWWKDMVKIFWRFDIVIFGNPDKTLPKKNTWMIAYIWCGISQLSGKFLFIYVVIVFRSWWHADMGIGLFKLDIVV